MNIFATSTSPREAAAWLDDRRKNSAIRESAQMLSAVIWANAPEFAERHELYREAFKNHPCTLWVGRSLQSYTWLLSHFECLLEQWGTPHTTARLLPALIDYPQAYLLKFKFENPLEFCNQASNLTMGIDFRGVGSVQDNYRAYLSYRWNYTDVFTPSWTRGQRPDWYTANRPQPENPSSAR